MTPLDAASSPTLGFERPQDRAAVDALIDRVFGPGRYTKVSERVREIATALPEVSVLAMGAAGPVGCARMSAITVCGRRLAFLGPLAVDPVMRSQGLGATLVSQACEAAARAGLEAVLLVGDPPFFAPLGFSAAPAARIVLPGPVDQGRVLIRALTERGDQGLEGPVSR
jgi:predicted N-acetyltransferase YhbS